jgi:hypothetical protein
MVSLQIGSSPKQQFRVSVSQICQRQVNTKYKPLSVIMPAHFIPTMSARLIRLFSKGLDCTAFKSLQENYDIDRFA